MKFLQVTLDLASFGEDWEILNGHRLLGCVLRVGRQTLAGSAAVTGR